MLVLLRKIFEMLDPRERRIFTILIGVMIIAAFAEIVGLGLFMALLGVLAEPDQITEIDLLRRAYDMLGFESVFSFQLVVSLFVGLAIFLGLLVKAGTLYATIRFSTYCGYRLSARLLQAYLTQPYEWSLTRNTADLGRQILVECEQLVNKVITPSLRILASLILAVSIVGFLITVDPFTALMAFGILGGGYGGIYLVVRARLQRNGALLLQANKERFRITQEATGGIKDVKLAGLEGVYATAFRAPAARRASLAIRQQVYTELPRFVLEGLTFAILLVMVLFLLVRYEGNLVSAIPTLGIFAFSVMRILPALQQVYHGLALIRTGFAVTNNIYREFIETNAGNLAAARTDHGNRLDMQQGLTMKNVAYTYPSAEKTALKDLSITFEAGSITGIVGGTGAGKTTFVDLLLGLLRPEVGQISVDGTPIEGQALRAWQNSIGYVPQQIFLIDDTITANIAFGVPRDQIDIEAVREAARMAELDAFILSELPQGYDTTVGERGVRLSGGQRQRIGIARALYRKPSILILDEATSALDNITERAVMQSVLSLEGQKTIIMIAHRLSTVENCDSIVLMEHGQVVARGSYTELADTNTTFRKMLGTDELHMS